MKSSIILKLVSILFVMSLIVGLAACGVFQNSTSNSPDAQTQKPVTVEKSGAVLWGENCSRCHGAPNAGSFGEQQWEVIGKHMRIRGNLTAKETEKIVEFLKQAN